MPSGKLRVLIGATEIYPLAKTGGLADATAALGAALALLDIEPHFIMPAYAPALAQVGRIERSIQLPILQGLEGGRLLSGVTPDSGLPVHLVDLPGLNGDHGELYVDENGQEHPDNPRRFAALAQAITLVALGRLEQRPFAVMHCNDWHTGLAPLLLLNQARGARSASVFTVHNMAFQGQCPPEQWSQLGISLPPEQRARIEQYGRISFLKAGLEFADELTTVSPRYAEEIQTAEFGFGLEPVMQSRHHHLTGILNGIDTSFWSPEHSPWLPAPYSARDLTGKAICKAQLQQQLGLEPNPTAPLLVFIGRLTWQKMADVLLEMLPDYLAGAADRQFVLLGQGDRPLEAGFRDLAQAYPDRVRALIGYTEASAHRLHAAGDILIHGSRFEPCGLTQMYAMQFGTIPVVRPVGGLADTVIDSSAEALKSGRATGFFFDQTSPAGMLGGLERALALYRQPEAWRRLQQTAMRQDFSWNASARTYQAVYHRACQGRRLAA